jgi:hypothetical protein
LVSEGGLGISCDLGTTGAATTAGSAALAFLAFFSAAGAAATTGAAATCSVSVLVEVVFLGILLYYILGFTF